MNKKASLYELENVWSIDDLYRGLAFLNVEKAIDKATSPLPRK